MCSGWPSGWDGLVGYGCMGMYINCSLFRQYQRCYTYTKEAGSRRCSMYILRLDSILTNSGIYLVCLCLNTSLFILFFLVRWFVGSFVGSLVRSLVCLFVRWLYRSFFSSFFYYYLIILIGNHWVKIENRRHFFDHFAAVNKFDPLVPANWYSISRERFLRAKV